LNIEVDATMGKGKLIDEIFGQKCEGNFIQPTFITDYPKEMSPLCKEHRDNPELTERFQIIIAGSEIGRAHAELNDPIDQSDRFEIQKKLIEHGDEEAMMPDYEFVEMLEYGMPPSFGFGFGERFFAVLLGKPIRETQLFPLMKPRKEE
jgi:lysyl-tRNA synthetase class 2